MSKFVPPKNQPGNARKDGFYVSRDYSRLNKDDIKTFYVEPENPTVGYDEDGRPCRMVTLSFKRAKDTSDRGQPTPDWKGNFIIVRENYSRLLSFAEMIVSSFAKGYPEARKVCKGFEIALERYTDPLDETPYYEE